MAKVTYYRQCRLSKKIPTGEKRQMSWIPEEFAVLNKVLKLRDSDGKWEDGWVVTEASQTRLAHQDVPDYHDGIKSHRKATGDALPKNK